MKIYVSYFYKVRFFEPYMIPFSTAKYPPFWFKEQRKDKNGVWNGISVPPLVPGPTCDDLCHGSDFCNPPNPSQCAFLRTYRKQLDNLNFNEIIGKLESIAAKVQRDEGFTEEPVIVLLVFEAPQNLCSERQALRAWFKDNGRELPEWN